MVLPILLSSPALMKLTAAVLKRTKEAAWSPLMLKQEVLYSMSIIIKGNVSLDCNIGWQWNTENMHSRNLLQTLHNNFGLILWWHKNTVVLGNLPTEPIHHVIQLFHLHLKGKSMCLYHNLKMFVLFKCSCCSVGRNLLNVALASKQLISMKWQGWHFYTISNAYISTQVLFVYPSTVRGAIMQFVVSDTKKPLTFSHKWASLAPLSLAWVRHFSSENDQVYHL